MWLASSSSLPASSTAYTMKLLDPSCVSSNTTRPPAVSKSSVTSPPDPLKPYDGSSGAGVGSGVGVSVGSGVGLSAGSGVGESAGSAVWLDVAVGSGVGVNVGDGLAVSPAGVSVGSPAPPLQPARPVDMASARKVRCLIGSKLVDSCEFSRPFIRKPAARSRPAWAYRWTQMA